MLNMINAIIQENLVIIHHITLQVLRISIISRIASVSIVSFTGDNPSKGLIRLRSIPVTRSLPIIMLYISEDLSVLDFTLKVWGLLRAGKICTNRWSLS